MKRHFTHLFLFVFLIAGVNLYGGEPTNKELFTVNCDAVNVTVIGSTIIVSGLTAQQNTVEYLGEATGFQTIAACQNDCASTVEINNLTPGHYEIKVQQSGGGYCFRSFPRVEVTSDGGDDCNASAGSIATDGPTSICIDGVRTPLNFTVTPGGIGSNRGWIITDDQRNILALPAAPPFDLEDAGPGTCRVYYIRYEDNLQGLNVGQSLANLSGCFDLSNAIEIVREAPDGGRVTTQDGQTEITVCAGNAFVPVTRQTSALALSYWYIITDENDNILDFLNPGSASPTDDAVLDLSPAPPGICRIWGWSYRGLGDPVRGQSIFTLTDDPCETISNNFIMVNRVTTGAVCDNNGGNTSGVNCDAVTASVSNGVIIVNGLNAERNTIEIQGAGTGYVPRLICRDDCGSTIEIPGLPEGEYTVKIQQQDANDYCYTERMVTVGGNSGCTANAGLISTDGPTTICIDGIRTPLNFTVSPGGIGSNRGWIITDESRNILALPAAPPFDLEDAGPGTCRIYYIRYENDLQGLMMGQNLANLTGCFDLSNAILIDRVTSGGPCEDGGNTGGVNCDAVTASVSNGVIIVNGLNAERNTIEIQGAGTGYVPRLICRDDCGSTVEIPGLPEGEYTVKIQQQDANDYCYTERNVTVGGNTGGGCTANAGSISTGGPTTICIDGIRTPLNFTVSPGGIGSNRGWIITDESRNILALPAAPPFDLEDAGPGTCRIYYIRYENDLQGLMMGQNLANLIGCFDLSNAILIDRVTSGGPCEDGGNTGGVNCDAVTANVSNGVIIVNGLNAERNTVEVQGAGTGYVPRLICRDDCGNTVEIPGLPKGEYTVKIQQQDANDYCYTERNVTVVGNNGDGGNDCNANAGSISTDGPTSICIDGVRTPLNFTVTPGGIGSNRGWIITDESRNILALPAAPPFDLEDAGPGTCRVYYIRYEDNLQGLNVGRNLANLTGCFDLSNAIEIVREAPDGGRVTTQDGQTEITVCAGNAFVPVTRQTSALALSYWYIITDENDNILDFVNPDSASPTDDAVLDLSAAPPGVCRIWGWSYRGLGDPVRGQSIFTLTDDPCETISNNFITVNRITGGQCDPSGGCDGRITGVSLVRSNGARRIDLTNGQTVNRSDIGFDAGFLRFHTAGTFESIKIEIRGAVHQDNVENFRPYDSPHFHIENGTYMVRAQVYSEDHARGTLCSEFNFTFSIIDNNAVEQFVAWLGGSQEACPVISPAAGRVAAELRGRTLSISGDFRNLIGDFDRNIANGAHIHRAITGRNGDIEFILETRLESSQRNGQFQARDNTFELTDDQIHALRNREFYINIHSTVFSSGEIRGQLLPQVSELFQANLLGINEVPANNSEATGNVLLELRGQQLIASGSFDNFTSEVATDLAGGGHIHRGFAGQNGDIELLFDLTLDADRMGGIIDPSRNTFTLTNEQVHTLRQQGFYINIHSQANRPGEVRGQIAPFGSTYFVANLEGGQEVPPISVSSDGRIHVTFDGDRSISLSGSFNNLESDLNRDLAGGVHLHLAPRGQNGDIIFLVETETNDERNGVFLPENNTFRLSESQVRALFQEGIYLNVHSLVNVPGELRGQVVGQTIDACGNPNPSSSRNAPMLDLAAFQAARQIDLQWVSNTGYKNDYFVIEKSTDGENFAPLQKLTNEDFSEEVAAFNLVDETPVMGMNYYKVKQVHVDGTFEYSEVRTVEFNIDLDKVGIYPNPAQAAVLVNLSEYQGKKGNLSFYNQYGQLIKAIEMETIAASPIEVSLEEFTNGTYHVFIQLEGGRKPISKKLQVTKLY